MKLTTIFARLARQNFFQLWRVLLVLPVVSAYGADSSSSTVGQISDFGTLNSSVFVDANNLAKSFTTGSRSSFVDRGFGFEVRSDTPNGASAPVSTRISRASEYGFAVSCAPPFCPVEIPVGGTFTVNGTWSQTTNFLEMRYSYQVFERNRTLDLFDISFFEDPKLEVRARVNGVAVPVTVINNSNGTYSISQQFSASAAIFLGTPGLILEEVFADIDGDGTPQFIDFAHTFTSSFVTLDPTVQIVPTSVPVPGALWLFGSVLLGWVRSRKFAHST